MKTIRFVSYKGPGTWYQLLIELFTHSPYTHIGIVIDDTLYDIDFFEKYRKQPFNWPVEHYTESYFIVHDNVADYATGYLEGNLRREYSLRELARVVLKKFGLGNLIKDDPSRSSCVEATQDFIIALDDKFGIFNIHPRNLLRDQSMAFDVAELTEMIALLSMKYRTI